ncbi:hypothetical protein CEQ90_08105 [Lewinellaceae bacterium SD302]|nr:hypothetical protein CEQ90_08105 [Lewinellaceae bacterium SD302]
MRMMNNSVQLAGSLAADPELRMLSDGTYVANFRLRTFRGESGEQDGNQYFNLTAWRTIAREIDRNFKKGSEVYVRGELRNRLHQRNGERYYRTEIHVYEFLALARPKPAAVFGNQLNEAI